VLGKGSLGEIVESRRNWRWPQKREGRYLTRRTPATMPVLSMISNTLLPPQPLHQASFAATLWHAGTLRRYILVC